MKLTDGYDRRTTVARIADFKAIAPEECKTLQPGQEIFARQWGTTKARTVRVNGKPKTWKRQPERVEVPIKYGMYEFDRFSPEECLKQTSEWVEVNLGRERKLEVAIANPQRRTIEFKTIQARFPSDNIAIHKDTAGNGWTITHPASGKAYATGLTFAATVDKVHKLLAISDGVLEDAHRDIGCRRIAAEAIA